jgi:hypothetical protein
LICFLVSGSHRVPPSPRHGWLPLHGASGWWQPTVNLLGCLFLGVAAITGYVPMTLR